jgi:large subunit ribosomal protein L15
MFLNTIAPAEGSNIDKQRVGRGIGSTKGKTCGRGHKGQHSRKGGYNKIGFEGGQMPLQRRLPKVGFKSTKNKSSTEVRLDAIDKLLLDVINMDVLHSLNLVPISCKTAKIIDAGKLKKTITIKGIKVSEGARKQIESAGGMVEV